MPTTETQQRRDDVVNSLFIEPGRPASRLPGIELPATQFPAQDSVIERVSGTAEQRSNPRPELVPTPEEPVLTPQDIGPADDAPFELIDSVPAIRPVDEIEAPMLIPLDSAELDSAEEPSSLFEPAGDLTTPEPVPLLLPDAVDSAPLLLPDSLDQSQAAPVADSPAMLASLLLLAVRPHRWRRALRRWRRRSQV